MTERLRCCVPGCNRTKQCDGATEWICGKHWAVVSRRQRGRLADNRRYIRRACRLEPLSREFWKLPPGSPARIKAVRMWDLHDAIWTRCKAEAIERAVGL